MTHYRNPELIYNKLVAYRMIHMQMGVDYMRNCQVVALYIVHKSILFLGIGHAGIDNGTFARGFIYNHIRIDAEY